MEIETPHDYVTVTPSCRDCPGIIRHGVVAVAVVVVVVVVAVVVIGSMCSRPCAVRPRAAAVCGIVDALGRIRDLK